MSDQTNSNLGGSNPQGTGGNARRFRYSEGVARAAEGGAVVELPTPGLPLEWTKITWAMLIAAALFLAFYQSEILSLTNTWYTDLGWSHGFVVPLISIFFIWTKWETLRLMVPRGTWVGALLLLFGVAGHVVFRATGTVQMSNLSMLVVMYGFVLFVFGWDHLRILWLPITFLIFAVPPPSPLYVAITTPMQKIAAELGVRLLPLFGSMGMREGTTIRVANGTGWLRLNVAEACSGMRMLVAFVALAVALAYSTNRPVWQKLTLAIGALPIAILCNALRVTLTGVLGARLGGEWARGSTHETLGLFMLVPALGMQLGLAWLLDHLFIEDGTQTPTGERA